MIASIDNEASMGALRMIRLLCFYHFDNDPLEMFYQARLRSDENQGDTAWLPWPAVSTDLLGLQHALQASAALLASFSLIRKNTDGTLSLHPLVHE